MTGPAPGLPPRAAGVAHLAEQVLAAARAGDTDTMSALLLTALGLPRHTVGQTPAPRVTIFWWVCPFCPDETTGEPGSGRHGEERCMDCAGVGLLTRDQITDPGAFPPGELRRAPTPPAVMRQPCVDCAYRPGSPEDPDAGTGSRPGPEVPFWCHHGLHRRGGPDSADYEASAYVGRLPLGAMLCAGWWRQATGGPPPARPYRDPGGANRAADAPPEPTDA